MRGERENNLMILIPSSFRTFPYQAWIYAILQSHWIPVKTDLFQVFHVSLADVLERIFLQRAGVH